ncbi:MAG: glycogen/starch synthase [Bacteroidota bacterium]|nr:glycogen synthase [Candidatus Kapabacteria bacterium]MDW8074306.1 glycogen/starch synthase [Bacteroidota bacterium]MDW8271218.1 glycogen/starch synthase [Bacteroidota bacterium]
MNILVTAAECTPFAKIGGLADVVAALAKHWHALGHNVRIILPKYATIDTDRWEIKPTHIVVSVPMGWWQEYTRVWRGVLPGTDVPVYFLESHDYYDRPGIYGDPEGYADNDRRFLFLSRATFEVASSMDFVPDIIHAHDWHTAFALAFLKSHYRYHPRFARTAGVFTIHNIAYQGQSDPYRVLPLAGFRVEEFHGSWFDHDGVVNMMKTGIMFADKITTVSPTYAREIRWTSAGMGMQPYLNLRGADFLGVLNGADYTEWDPTSDPHIVATYSAESLASKEANKAALLAETVPPHDRIVEVPVIGMVSRLTQQKGIDLLLGCMEQFARSGRARFVILGSGERRYEHALHLLAHRHPTRIILYTGYNSALSHHVIASADYLVMPSLFEPCGLTQIYALRYGTVPIVRATGGLADTVQEYNPVTTEGTGFTFREYSVSAFAHAIERALSYYRHPFHWDRIRRNGMQQDFSAAKSAQQYIDVFRWALEKIGRVV